MCDEAGGYKSNNGYILYNKANTVYKKKSGVYNINSAKTRELFRNEPAPFPST